MADAPGHAEALPENLVTQEERVPEAIKETTEEPTSSVSNSMPNLQVQICEPLTFFVLEMTFCPPLIYNATSFRNKHCCQWERTLQLSLLIWRMMLTQPLLRHSYQRYL
jgi:hypothetical protein